MAGSAPSRKAEPRPPRVDELSALPRIEQRAGELLRGHEAYPVFSGHGLDLPTLQAGLRRGLLWIIEGADDGIAGYLLGGTLDGDFHVLQMDVDPGHARRGYGRALLQHALAEAKALDYPAAVLTTLSDVPWNAAFYTSEGFTLLPEPEWGAGLRGVMAEEAALGFPMHLRVAMRRVL